MHASSSTSEQPEKSVDRGKLNCYIQHIARILNRSIKKMTLDDGQQFRSATGKLLALIEQSDKATKDSFLKQSLTINTLITVLQIVECEQTISNIINIFIELVGKANSAKRASLLVKHGLTIVLFQILKLAYTNELCLPDDVLISIHVLLSQIGRKDHKFAVKARLHQNLMLTLNLVMAHFHNFQKLQPLLQVMKMYTNNSVNASELGKHNTVGVMLKIIVTCGKRHTIDLKLALENLCNLTKSKVNATRLIEMEGVPQLLSHHSEWQQLDSKHRHLKIRRCILLVLRNVTELKAGRIAFVDADGIRILYEGAIEASDCRDMEGLILLSSIILRKCCPRASLPIVSTLSPVLFELPASTTHTPECYFLSNYPAQLSPGEYSESSSSAEFALAEKLERVCCAFRNLVFGVPQDDAQINPAGIDSDMWSLDENEDDMDSDDERSRNDPDEPDEDQQGFLEPPETRPLEDLRMYDIFFPELLEQVFQPSSYAAYMTSQRLDSVNLSVQPTVLASERSPTTNTSSDVILKKLNSNFVIGSSSFSKQHSHCLNSSTTPVDGGHQCDEKSASSVSLKTGPSVINLELGQYWSPSVSRKNRAVSKGKCKKKVPTPKEKHSNRRTSTTCLDESVCDALSNLSFSVQDCEESSQVRCSSSEDLHVDFCYFPHDPLLYAQLSSGTNSIFRFQKLAYPDMFGVKGLPTVMESQVPRKFGVQRAKIFEDIERMIYPGNLLNDVVYDLDRLVLEAKNVGNPVGLNLANNDEFRLGLMSAESGLLQFNSQFECGNLRKAIHVRQYEYDLILNPDINSDHHHQWFYFEVNNMQADKPYRFNIINCEKLNSQFNFGMQPLMMSVMEAVQGNFCWRRVGTDICYYKNNFTRSSQRSSGAHGKTYYTATFTVTFQHSGDICYISYHYPYSYTALQTHLMQWEQRYDSSLIFFRNQTLCTTLGGNLVPVLTITAQPKTTDKEGVEELRSRPYIFLSGRVHPGESNASWVMKGTIDFLMSTKKQAQQVRERYIFKIVPMLNPDGVVNGNHRLSLVGEDLNRQWGKPCKILHPTIYHTKGLLQYLNTVNKTPMVYCDYHGHSRRKNIFLYGCSPNQTWIANDTLNPASAGSKPIDVSYKQLPRLLKATCPSFYLKNCSFVVEKSKENTARVVVWRHIGVVRSYTMESSYCGCDQGKYKDMQITTAMLEEMGHKFCEALLGLATEGAGYDQQMPVFDFETAADDFEYDLDDRLVLSTKAEGCNVDSLFEESDSYDDNEEEEEEGEFDNSFE